MPVRLSEAAADDLAAIFDFTFDRWGEAQAQRYLEGLRERLAAFETTAGEPGDPGFLRLRYRSHNLFACRNQDGILIVRILHVRMDERRHLP